LKNLFIILDETEHFH